MSDDTKTTAELFFGSDESVTSTYAPSLADSMNELRDRQGLSETDTDKLMSETSHFFAGAGIESAYASKFHAEIVRHLAEPPDDATFGQWQTQARQRVRERYPDDGEKRLELANTFVDSFGMVSDQLVAARYKANPSLVLALADRAYSLRPRKTK